MSASTIVKTPVETPFAVEAPAGPGWGGEVFTSSPGTEGPWYEGGLSGAAHSEYWNPNNKALDNMGRVIAGRPTY